MSKHAWSDVAKDGLWKNNAALVQILGMCPTMAVTTTAANALGLGMATMLVMTLSNFVVALVRQWIPTEIRIPIYVLIIAAFVTCVELLMKAYTSALYQSLGIFIALIVTNCLVIGRLEAFANRNPALLSAFDGLMMGLGFTAVLVVLGGIREVLGQGTLFAGVDTLLGSWAAVLRIQVTQGDSGFLLAILPPGGFLVLGLLIALKNMINALFARQTSTAAPVIERARATQL
ncbi:MAG: electron transport complex subunit E [Aeromonadaceae bacterium]